MIRLGAALQEARRWLWLVALLAGLAGGWRIFITRPRQGRQVAAAAGAAGQRIEEVRAAAARGDDTEVQRRHAEAVERAEELLGRRR